MKATWQKELDNIKQQVAKAKKLTEPQRFALDERIEELQQRINAA